MSTKKLKHHNENKIFLFFVTPCVAPQVDSNPHTVIAVEDSSARRIKINK